MATIAKLDSNGVQVLPEGQRGKMTSPQVHSSTDLTPSHDGMSLTNNFIFSFFYCFFSSSFYFALNS